MSDNYTHFWVNESSPSKKSDGKLSIILHCFFHFSYCFLLWRLASSISSSAHIVPSWTLWWTPFDVRMRLTGQLLDKFCFKPAASMKMQSSTKPLRPSLCSVLSCQPKWQTVQSIFTADLWPGSRTLSFQTGSLWTIVEADLCALSAVNGLENCWAEKEIFWHLAH